MKTGEKVVIAAGLAGLTYAILKSRVSAEPLPGQGQLSITSNPSGASVIIDGNLIGATPLTINLDPGVYIYQLSKAGYEQESGQAIIIEDRVIQLDVILTLSSPPPEPQSFDLYINLLSMADVFAIQHVMIEKYTWGGTLSDSGSNQLIVGAIGQGDKNQTGLYFPNIGISREAQITKAELLLVSKVTMSTPNCYSIIRFQDSGDANPWVSGGLTWYYDDPPNDIPAANILDFLSRPKTIPVDLGTLSSLGAESVYTSPSLISILQPIFSKSDWMPGNALALFLDDVDGRSTPPSGYRVFYAEGAKAPVLHISGLQ